MNFPAAARLSGGFAMIYIGWFDGYYTSVNIRVIHEMCQGLEVSLTDFFNSPLFLESNLEP